MGGVPTRALVEQGFEIAKEATAQAAKTTTAENKAILAEITKKMGSPKEPMGDKTVFTELEAMADAMAKANEKKDKLMIPSNRLMINFLNSEMAPKQKGHLFLGYLYFQNPGVIKVVTRIKAAVDSSRGSVDVMLASMKGSKNDRYNYGRDYMKRGDLYTSSGVPPELYTYAAKLAGTEKTNYETQTVYLSVPAKELMGVFLNAYSRLGACNSIQIYYDEVEAGQL